MLLTNQYRARRGRKMATKASKTPKRGKLSRNRNSSRGSVLVSKHYQFVKQRWLVKITGLYRVQVSGKVLVSPSAFQKCRLVSKWLCLRYFNYLTQYWRLIFLKCKSILVCYRKIHLIQQCVKLNKNVIGRILSSKWKIQSAANTQYNALWHKADISTFFYLIFSVPFSI